jgi:hypothetical protein
MYHFRMCGIIKDANYNQKAHEVLYKDRRLTGDKVLVKEIEELVDNTYDVKAVIMTLNKLCSHAEIWGNYHEL